MMKVVGPSEVNTALVCAKCFGQYYDRIYVDFDCNYDQGSFIYDGEGTRMVRPTAVTHHQDDLFLCDQCLEQAMELVKDERRERLSEEAKQALNKKPRPRGIKSKAGTNA